LTLREAAVLAGVDEASLVSLCDDGTLLFETEKRGRKAVRVVRLRDLADVHPGVLGLRSERPEPEPEPEPETEPEAVPETETAVDLARGDDVDISIADAVRASGTSRNALIELCQDLETRLDLADRERQASTASLLMAQRRVLDLEVHARPKPWARASGAFLGLLSITAIVLVVQLPGDLRDAANEQAAETRAALSVDLEGVRAEIEAVTVRDADARASFADRIESSEEVIAGGQRAFEDLARQARQEREVSSGQRVRLESTLDGLAQRLAAAEDDARRRAVELELLVSSSSRERARFAERLAAAERVAEDARVQLAAERRSSAEERVAFERTLEDLSQAEEQYDARHAEDMRALRDEVRAALQAVPSPAIPAPTVKAGATNDSWMSRALRTLTGSPVQPVQPDEPERAGRPEKNDGV